MNDVPQVHLDPPQLRTLLLTDLCDSTELVERVGDAAAAELFREHDALVLQLQQRWRGRLIDRSDGLLLLFERPIDGLGFALDYQQGLHDLGHARGLRLLARAGLHVGEVLTWRNSEEAVQIGAKPLEVEGLAKPIAARLMALARPGQILLSAVAESLTQRAARELGARGERLLWKSYGRWRFKGMPTRMEIYEVGEIGLTPLRMPKNSAKAWRDIPLWRRPAALAAEAAVLATIAVCGWLFTRPEPAIAFAERDWVVVGDMRNLTGDTLLDDSLQQAFRISLEQSRYVNVVSDLKVRDTLRRMRAGDRDTSDRATASEVAIRDGAALLVMPTVSEVGGRMRVTAEVVSPQTGELLFVASADGKGRASLLRNIDSVVADVRAGLGESNESLNRSLQPLPEVTTSSLDALRAYALGQKAYAAGNFDEALRFYGAATRTDPDFALAWMGSMRSLYSMERLPEAKQMLLQALKVADHLAPREELYLRAWKAEFDDPGEALESWRTLAKLYPDFIQAQGNTAMALQANNMFAESIPYAARTATPQGDFATRGLDTMGRSLLALGRYQESAQAFDRAIALGYNSSLRRRMSVDLARKDFDAARKLEARLDGSDPFNYIERITMAVDQQQWRRAAELAEAGQARVAPGLDFVRDGLRLQQATALWLDGDKPRAADIAEHVGAQAVRRIAAGDIRNANEAGLALSAALLLQRLGHGDAARAIVAEVRSNPDLQGYPGVADMVTVIRAREELAANRPAAARTLLLPMLQAGNERYQARVALWEAEAALDNAKAAVVQARWLAEHRGHAYSELGFGQALQTINVADANMAAMRAAGSAASNGGRRQDRVWAEPLLPGYLRVRVATLPASSRGLL
ncbi:MAG TPA: putative peptide modification system cyclase [Stenotrophomonas sp.]|nr:putative peptide modification system cyclase [Stenotrophomonas sp.]